MITFPCSHCGKSLMAEDELAGKRVKCLGCNQPASVPAPRDLAASASGPNRPAPEPMSCPAPDETSLLPADAPAPPLLADAPTIPRVVSAAGFGPDTELGRETISRKAVAGYPAELTEFLAPPQAPDELGRLGGFRILKILGAGGMGVVFQGEDAKLGRKVAIKAMLPHLAGSKAFHERFLREARSAAALEHDHIVPIFHVAEDRGVPFIAMPFLKGQSLEERLKHEPTLPLAEVVRIGGETAEGLGAAHEQGLVHRDIKPGNLWLEAPMGRVKILDFGLARATADKAQLTQQGAIIGTPEYMAPEQADGAAVDARSDLFSLGCVLYRLCTGRLPFRGPDMISTLIAVATEDPAPPMNVRREVPRALSDLVMQLLAKAPRERPASALAVADELNKIGRRLEGQPSKPALTKGTTHSKGGRLARLAGALVAVLVLAAVGYACFSVIVRVETANGILIVEIPEEQANNVQLSVKQGGNQIELLDLKSQKKVALKAGKYDLELVGGKDGLRLETNHYDVKQGDRLVAKVIFEPKAAGRGALPGPVIDVVFGKGEVQDATGHVKNIQVDKVAFVKGIAGRPAGQFDQSSVTLGRPKLLDMNTRPFTLEAVVRLKNEVGRSFGLVAGWHNAGPAGALFLGFFGYQLHLNYEGKERQHLAPQFREAVQPGTWNHLVLVRQQSHLILYLNGEQAASVDDVAADLHTANFDFRIGDENSRHAAFRGDIQFVRVYDVPLTQQQVRERAAAVLP